MDPEVTNRIQDANWEELYPILIVFGQTRLQHALKTNGNPVIEGLDANVLLDQAIDKTLDGTRVWDFTNVDLVTHLKGVIRSDVSSFFKKDIATMVVPPIQTEDGPINVVEVIGDSSLSPDSAITNHEDESVKAEHLEAFKASITGDAELIELLDAYDAGFTTPRDISELTGMEPRRIDELKRKLLTKYLRFTNKYAGALKRADLVRGHR